MKYIAVGLLMSIQTVVEGIAQGIMYISFGFIWASEKIEDVVHTLKQDLK